MTVTSRPVLRFSPKMLSLGEVTAVAPERDRSGASNSLTLDRPLVGAAMRANGFLFVNGTPTDCVHLAVTGLLDELPDMVVSGINLGANMGDDTIYSGHRRARPKAFCSAFRRSRFANKAGGNFATAAGRSPIVRRYRRRQSRR